ncbi:MAG: DUF2341 domain-containing protein [Armatimonadetes bacterium]|nr:DUF2341 domain-containing protein [Armatimonadota bacterium]
MKNYFRTAVLLSALALIFGGPGTQTNAAGGKTALVPREWKFKRTITLKPATRRADTAVAVTLATKTMGKPYRGTNPDGSDLRFTISDGKTLLNHWVESWDNKGTSKIWVKIPVPGADKIVMYYGNPKAKSLSNGEEVFDFFDDFNNGIWDKPVNRPVYTPSQDRKHPDAHRHLRSVLCEPSVIFEDNIFKMWYTTEEAPWQSKSKRLANGLAYATSKDGIHWTRYPVHPLITEVWPDSVSRCFVLKHKGAYYHFASNVEQGDGSILRWTSKDGIHWGDKTKVLTPEKPRETGYHNPAVFVDDDGVWKMLINTEDRLALATSEDGLHWTKWGDGAGVSIPPRCEGDPFVKKIGDTYFCWHSEARGGGPLNISAHWSKDLIHWESGFKNPQISHTRPWERGLGTTDVQCAKQIADTAIVEHNGKLWLYYCGTQSQFGLATFDGTWNDLADRMLNNPPLAKWDTGSFFGSVEGKQLKMSDDESNYDPLIVDSVSLSDAEGYIFEFKARKYAGPSYQIMPVVRHIDRTTFARFWLYDNTTTWYHEFRNPAIPPGWQWPLGATNVGANNICDDKWHNWKIVVKGDKNTLYLDGKLIGSCTSIPELVNRTDLKVGLSTFDTFAAFDDVRVRKYVEVEPVCTISWSAESVR